MGAAVGRRAAATSGAPAHLVSAGSAGLVLAVGARARAQREPDCRRSRLRGAQAVPDTSPSACHLSRFDRRCRMPRRLLTRRGRSWLRAARSPRRCDARDEMRPSSPSPAASDGGLRDGGHVGDGIVFTHRHNAAPGTDVQRRDAGGPNLVSVKETLAPGVGSDNAVGRRSRWGRPTSRHLTWTVVGVVAT